MGCIIPSFLLAVHHWGDLWRALFLAFYLQYISGEICWMQYTKLILTAHQWQTLWDTLFLALTVNSVGISVGCIILNSNLQCISGKLCVMQYSKLLLTAHHWEYLWDA